MTIPPGKILNRKNTAIHMICRLSDLKVGDKLMNASGDFVDVNWFGEVKDITNDSITIKFLNYKLWLLLNLRDYMYYVDEKTYNTFLIKAILNEV